MNPNQIESLRQQHESLQAEISRGERDYRDSIRREDEKPYDWELVTDSE